MEAEYVAMTEAIKETIWLISLIDNLCFFQKYIDVYCDSQSAIAFAKNQLYH